MRNLDAKIAIITGTVFAGVLVAGALAAPRTSNDGGSGTPANSSAAFVMEPSFETAMTSQFDDSDTYDDYYDDDEDYDDYDDDRYEHHDDDDDDHERGRDHDDDDHDRYEDDD